MAAQPLQRIAFAILLIGKQIALGRIGFEIVKRRDRVRTGPERRMGGDVVDPLCADVNGAAILHAFELLAAGREHYCFISSNGSVDSGVRSQVVGSLSANRHEPLRPVSTSCSRSSRQVVSPKPAMRVSQPGFTTIL